MCSTLCACRYEKILFSVLELAKIQGEVPAALLEHVIMRVMGSPGAQPAQTRRLSSEPGTGAETIDLLIWAASIGSASTTQALIDCGAPGAPILLLPSKACSEALEFYWVLCSRSFTSCLIVCSLQIVLTNVEWQKVACTGKGVLRASCRCLAGI